MICRRQRPLADVRGYRSWSAWTPKGDAGTTFGRFTYQGYALGFGEFHGRFDATFGGRVRGLAGPYGDPVVTSSKMAQDNLPR